MIDRLLRALRRSALWWVAAVVFLALSIPAIFDLKSLFVGLAVVCAGLGLAVAGFTYAGTSTPRRSEPPAPGAAAR